jgi:hypothetical protein
MKSTVCLILVAAGLVAFPRPLLAEQAVGTKVIEPQPPLAHAELAPGLKAAADHEGIKLFFLDDLDDSRPPSVDDAVVAWIGSTEGGVTHQWLMQLRRSVATAAEEKSAQRPDITKYLSWGPVITFKSKIEALEIWIAGPVDSPSSMTGPVQSAKTRRMRVCVPGDYLRLGLDGTARIIMHIEQRARETQREHLALNFGQIYAMDSPIKTRNIGYAKSVADQIGFSPEMDRAWIGGSVALETFYDTIEHVRLLRKIASVAIERPPLWKLALLVVGTQFKTMLGNGQTHPVDPGAFGLMAVKLECFSIPFEIFFGTDSLVFGELAVTAPSSPLDVCAGILGLLAVNPKDHRRMVQVVIISAQRGHAQNPAHEGSAPPR